MNYKKTYKQGSTRDSYYHGVDVKATYDQLVKLFGTPAMYGDSYSNPKIKMVWTLQSDEGEVVTIYDWYNEKWHIGASKRSGAERLKKYIGGKI